MTNNLNPNAKPFLWFVILFLVAIAMLFSLLGCDVTKKVSKTKSDSTIVSKQDSGRIDQASTSDKKENTWFKETIIYPPAGDEKKPDVNNYYNTTTPAVIYREGGTQSSKQDQNTYSSAWKNSYDSLQATIKQSDTEKHTKVLGFWDIVGIAAGVGIILIIISKLKIGIR